ncbi:hypothetical protein [Nitriliruptor alkaliphilus]|uniref:hypothetical protein n=1 Tax=Nitriliruptor alkaliphilus TaxID=427918 RepID=UPI0006978CFD|nr:hypothetical protein [Nitriliruptor alkaliphilus]
MNPAELLIGAADADGAALGRLRREVSALTARRGGPLHIGSLVTDLVGGYGPDRGLEDGWVVTLRHGAQLAALPPPGAPVEIETASPVIGSVYGQVVATHLDPPTDSLEADGTLPAGAADGRRRLVIDFGAVPDGLGLDDREQVAFERMRRGGKWFTADGHVQVTCNDDGLDDVTRYARWLASDGRAGLRTGLPGSPDRIERLLRSLLSALTVYESTFVTAGAWVWTRDALAARLEEPVGSGYLRDDCRSIAERANTLYADAASGVRQRSRRALAAELAEASDAWPDADRQRLCAGAAWLGTLFALTQTVAVELPGAGAALLGPAGQQVHAVSEPRFGIAGVLLLDPVDDEEAERLRQEARDELDRQSRARAEQEVEAPSFPFSVTVTDEAFSRGVLHIPDEVAGRLHVSDPVTVRLAYVPAGRFAHRPVVAAACGRPGQDGMFTFEWPALIGPGTRLDGLVSRRGRLVELRPVTRTVAG